MGKVSLPKTIIHNSVSLDGSFTDLDKEYVWLVYTVSKENLSTEDEMLEIDKS